MIKVITIDRNTAAERRISPRPRSRARTLIVEVLA
jgi:hypothetical protein